jgi:hypothetical protein
MAHPGCQGKITCHHQPIDLREKLMIFHPPFIKEWIE